MDKDELALLVAEIIHYQQSHGHIAAWGNDVCTQCEKISRSILNSLDREGVLSLDVGLSSP